MKLTSVMLADAAQVQSGKLFVLGGGFDTISVKSLPATHRNLSIAMVAEVGPDERQRDLELHISLIDEDGAPVGVEAKGMLRVGAPPNLPPGSPSVVPIVSPFHNITFPAAKGYAFVVTLDDTELARIPFRVVLAP
ncbi:MAG: hypothetical protein QGM46_01125 [Actinomycetota bacterium]|nr:hypothetical protein [Actinomycetota bacterium]MDK1017557.1 hypothetical protein [Actinomycetota bacterium]MDK1026941.1 hypothetical protein [Actinomycetota bacterium]MDK1038378.1 hypothetical protein [Actinomycetota bacterium]MDK1095737.1 hypothetical protein [Actinomycetota bacterium]